MCLGFLVDLGEVIDDSFGAYVEHRRDLRVCQSHFYEMNDVALAFREAEKAHSLLAGNLNIVVENR